MLAVLASSPAPPARAAEKAGAAGRPVAPAPASDANFASLSITEAVRLALQNNLGARVEKMQQDIADSRIIQSRAEFDPAFTLSGSYESIERLQNTQEFVATQSSLAPRTSRIFVEDNWRYETGIKGKLPFGTEYEFTVELNQLRNTLNIERPPSLFYPEYESFAGLRLTQPLLRDLGYNAQLAGLRVAQADRRLAALSWNLKVSELVAEVMKRYYDLVFSIEDTRIKSDNIRRARELEEQNRKRLEKGVGSQIDVQQAAVAASVREEEFISAQYLEREQANLLLRALLADIDIESIPNVRPVHRLASSAPAMNRTGLMRDAIANRLEYRQAREQLAKQDIKILFAKNQAWPRLDLFGTLGANGLRSGAGGALGDAFQGQTPAWSAGIMVTIPLGNRRAKAQLKEAQIEKEQLVLNYKQLEIDLALQVDTAVARVETSAKRLATARKSVEAAGITLEGEVKRLEQGVGISLNVLEAQKELAAASTREMAARADLSKSVVDLWHATGTLLERQNIHLEENPASPARPPAVKPARK